MKGTASRFSLLIIFLLFFSSSSLSARELTKEEIDAVEVGVNKQGSLQETETTPR